MTGEQVTAAAARLWKHFQERSKLDELPQDERPSSRAEGYTVQAAVARLSGQPIVGWKIAATSVAGQKHINVDGPLAAPLLESRVVRDTSGMPAFAMAGNIMKVAEAEFAFRFGRSLPPRSTPYSADEVLAAVESLHPGIEVPDSRYNVFVKVGAPQLIADLACACWYALGPATAADWRARDLAKHPAAALINGTSVATGTGANVLGDPRIALTWIANELSTFAGGIAAGQFVTTGTCVVPPAIAPGDRFTADFGEFGSVQVQLT
jgi:2-keto-4-pentenoate hydratase